MRLAEERRDVVEAERDVLTAKIPGLVAKVEEAEAEVEQAEALAVEALRTAKEARHDAVLEISPDAAQQAQIQMLQRSVADASKALELAEAAEAAAEATATEIDPQGKPVPVEVNGALQEAQKATEANTRPESNRPEARGFCPMWKTISRAMITKNPIVASHTPLRLSHAGGVSLRLTSL